MDNGLIVRQKVRVGAFNKIVFDALGTLEWVQNKADRARHEHEMTGLRENQIKQEGILTGLGFSLSQTREMLANESKAVIAVKSATSAPPYTIAYHPHQYGSNVVLTAVVTMSKTIHRTAAIIASIFVPFG